MKYIVIGIKRSPLRYCTGEFLDKRTGKNVSRIDPSSCQSIQPVILSQPVSSFKASEIMRAEYSTGKYDSVQIIKFKSIWSSFNLTGE
jgi:hypothetical protein